MVSGKKNTVNGQEVENFGYTYDTYGNIRSFNNGTTSHNYTYGDAEWKDLLTAVDGHELTYDEIGNPLSYYNGTSYTMDWSDGRKLTTLKKDGSSYTYKYDMNGIRSWKEGPDVRKKYIIVDGKAVGETVWDAKGDYLYNLRYTFDETGAVCGISQIKPNEESWTKYYFTKNLQGDVTGVYRANTDSTGIPSFTPVATYTYDSWGNVLTKSGEMADVNPFRYRGYYQDNETGFYYLQSRYYDPSIGRFINADSYSSTGQGFLGHNMFAYCLNSPVNCKDDQGKRAIYFVDSNKTITEKVEENTQTNTTRYRTTITYRVEHTYGFMLIACPFNPEPSKTETCSLEFDVRNDGMVLFDNMQENASLISHSAIRDEFAQEILTTARNQVNDALSGRTVFGISQELLAHYDMRNVPILKKHAQLANIGAAHKGKTGYDKNAAIFEIF